MIPNVAMVTSFRPSLLCTCSAVVNTFRVDVNRSNILPVQMVPEVKTNAAPRMSRVFTTFYLCTLACLSGSCFEIYVVT